MMLQAGFLSSLRGRFPLCQRCEQKTRSWGPGLCHFHDPSDGRCASKFEDELEARATGEGETPPPRNQDVSSKPTPQTQGLKEDEQASEMSCKNFGELSSITLQETLT